MTTLPRIATASVFVLLTASAGAASLDEDIAGDISDLRTLPSVLTLGPGSNLVAGHYGRGAFGGIDLDYLRIDLPAGHMLSRLWVLPGTTVGGGRAFIGMQAGDTFSVAPDAAEPGDLLGYTHFSTPAAPLDLLPGMGDNIGEGYGAMGFVPPLPGARYTFWIQETGGGATFDYRLDFEVSAVPLPGAFGLLLGALPLAAAGLRRRSAGDAQA